MEVYKEQNCIYKQQSQFRLKALLKESKSAVDVVTSVPIGSANDNCSTALLARACALFMAYSLFNGYNLAKQSHIFEKVIFHAFLKPVLPAFLQNFLEIKQNKVLLSNFKQGTTINVLVETKSKRAIAAKHMICHLAMSLILEANKLLQRY